MYKSKERKLQVFVSSTYKDLRTERQAAVEAILKAGHIPAGMELFTAGDQSQMDVIRKWIDQSDVYLLILGGRYGSTEPSTKISYTELEYNYALEKNIPMFSLVLSDRWVEEKVKMHGIEMMEGIAPVKRITFRNKVLTRLSALVDDEKDIKLSIYESLVDFSEDDRVIGWIRADNTVNQTALNAEISTLRDENKNLKSQIKDNEQTKIRNQTTSLEDQDLILKKILLNTKIVVPADATANEEEIQTTAFKCAYDNRDSLLTGVFNEYNMNKAENFFFYTLIPKLQAHGLADNERVPGKAYRRAYLNREGQAFFAREERRRLLSKEAAEQEGALIVEMTEPASEGNESDSIPSKVPKRT